jgi:hypothetical protein
MDNQENTNSENLTSKSVKMETIRQLAKRHMMDQNHTTTDEELKNAVLDLNIPEIAQYRPLLASRKKDPIS